MGFSSLAVATYLYVCLHVCVYLHHKPFTYGAAITTIYIDWRRADQPLADDRGRGTCGFARVQSPDADPNGGFGRVQPMAISRSWLLRGVKLNLEVVKILLISGKVQ